MLSRIFAPFTVSAPSVQTSKAPVQQRPALVADEINIKDQLQVQSARTGAIPATTLSLFAAPARTLPALNNSLNRLHSNPSEANFRDAQANFRVAIRALSIAELKQVLNGIQAEMGKTSDYRTQKFLDKIQLDARMELSEKEGVDHYPDATMPQLPGNTPETIVRNSLAKLLSNPTEANYREAQAGFRVALRPLSAPVLKAVEQQLRQQMQASNDYRTQKFLDEVLVDVKLELFEKDGPQSIPQPTVPPSPGSTPAAIVANSVARLQSNSTEDNFRTAQAGFRVALRNLSLAELKQTEALVADAIKGNSDYRTQKFLDAVASDVKFAIFEKGQG